MEIGRPKALEVEVLGESRYWAKYQVPMAWQSFREPQPIYPNQARKGTTYYCPQCHGPVHLRSGEHLLPHFFHVTPNDTCSAESIIHQAAKALLLYWINGQFPIRVAFSCPQCHHEGSYRLPFGQHLTAVQEYTVGSYRADIALIDDRGVPHAGLEILATHRVDEKKAAELDIPWVELEAELVLECPTVLWPIRWGGGWTVPSECDHCTPNWVPLPREGLRIIRGHCPRFPRYDIPDDTCYECRFHEGVHDDLGEVPHVHCAHTPDTARPWFQETRRILQDIKGVTYRTAKKPLGHRPQTRPSEQLQSSTQVNLTEEQQAVVEATNRIIEVRAYAGAGKTRTLAAFAAQRPRDRVLYVAFNRSVADRAVTETYMPR